MMPLARPSRRRPRSAAPVRTLRAILALTAMIGLAVSLSTDGPVLRAQVSQAVQEAIHNRMFVGEDYEFPEADGQAQRLQAEEQYQRALEIYGQLLRRAERWATNPPLGQDPQVLMAESQTLRRADGEGFYGQTYRPMQEVVLQRIRDLPTRWLEAWRDEVETIATIEWQRAQRDRTRLAVQRVADRWWPSRIGPEALDLAARLALEDGALQTAAFYWERMQRMYDVAFIDEPRRTLQLGIAYHLLGDRVSLAELRAFAARRLAQRSVVVGTSQRRRLVDLLSAETLPSIAARTAASAGDRSDTPHRAGSPRIVPEFDSVTRSHPPININPLFLEEGLPNFRWGRSDQLSTRNVMVVDPVGADGTVWISGPRRGMLIELGRGGEGQAAVSRRMIVDGNPVIPSEVPTQSRGGWQRPALQQRYGGATHNGILYAVYHPDNLVRPSDSPFAEDVLVAYDMAADGAIRWSVPAPAGDARPTPAGGSGEPFPGRLHLAATPAVGNGRIFLTAARPATSGTEYFALAVDADTGALLWSQKIGARLLAGINRMGNRSGLGDELAPAVYDHGMVYVQTNAGAVTALDAVTGQIRWTFRYPRRAELADSMFRNNNQPAANRFVGTEPLPHRGVVYIGADDAARMSALLARSGEFLRELPTTERDAADLEYVMGVVGDSLVLQGRERVRIYDLRLDTDVVPVNRSVIAETTPYAQAQQTLADPDFVTGRGLLSETTVYVPTRTEIVRYDVRTGRRLESIAWPSDVAYPPVGHLTHLRVRYPIGADETADAQATEADAADTDRRGVTDYLAIVAGDQSFHLFELAD